jgi:Mg2+ and Co2+ transporter CorA
LYRNDGDEHEDVAADQLAETIEPEKALVWIDCADPSNAEIDSLASQLQISHIAAEDLHHGGQRTKLEHYRDHFHVAVHDCYLVDDRLVTRRSTSCSATDGCCPFASSATIPSIRRPSSSTP